MSQLTIDFSAPRAEGERLGALCLAKVEREGFDSEGTALCITGWVRRHGPTSGEDLVDAAIAHGYRGRDLRCFGGVFQGLVNRNVLRVLRSDLPRRRGHGTSGGHLYGEVIA